ncbi:dihydrofolate reductase family protein [Tsukamurella tyrosinosolvens]|uniref:dihydrofolate reductase family protein n=2 Tax=Tsukamurella tyrosinosolvens TaxID=57704 RepID=UPI000C7EE097|nr:dihydrofolate reductase family protein [Tsukamurella tyrosinosolvens]AUN40967.1 hypothetical protein ASU32_13905 [Tsukamurella tyrosinosolvens]
MRSLVYYVAVSLDGRIAGPEGQYDFYPVDEEYSRQMNEEWGDGLPTGLHEALGITPPLTKWDTVVMGTTTYRIGADVGVNDPYSHLRTIVYSRSLDAADFPEVEVIAEDPVAHMRALKQEEGGDIWLCGGGKLAATLAPEVDRLALKIYPVTAGDGVPLFAGGFAPQQWKLISHRAFDIGVILAQYERA